MLNALLTYSRLYGQTNLGDYIQSLAAKQYLGNVDCLVCREALASYTGEDARVILNGWFMHDPLEWPPSERIHPLFVSFHINSVAREALTTSASISYLKQHEPIGCRDRYTMRLLVEHGIDAYFSGCLTLSLGLNYPRKESGRHIYFVDPHFTYETHVRAIAVYLARMVVNIRVVRTIAQKLYGGIDMKKLLKSSAFYGTYRTIFSDAVLTSAEYLTHGLRCDMETEESSFRLAEQRLRDYASARFVVTSRIHCALPCLGIGTPVLYVQDEDQAETSACRLDGLTELLHVVGCKAGILRCPLSDARISPEFSFANKHEHHALVKRLMDVCREFFSVAPGA